MKVVAVVQARSGSSRLPGKVMLEAGGKPLIGHMLDRIERAASLDGVVLATTVMAEDDELAAYVRGRGTPVFRGSVDDVLDRFYRAARWQGADVVVRLTGDCPLIDPAVVDLVVSGIAGGSFDQVVTGPSFPEGFDAEAVTFAALETAWSRATLRSEREHVTVYLRDHAEEFRRKVLELPDDLSDVRIVVDVPEDLPVVETLLGRFAPGSLGVAEIAALRRSEPTLFAGNSGVVRNEGYAISLAADGPAVREQYPPRRLDVSEQLWSRIERIVPAGTQTLSKGPTQYVRGVAPVFLDRGSGASVWDVDGNEYLDYVMGLGAVTLGYCDPHVDAAVSAQLAKGMSFSLLNRLEVEVAESLVDAIPCAQAVRFGKNGSDVTAGAVRVARAATGRERIACCGYHGWQDWYIGTTTRDKGVPGCVKELTHPFDFDDLDSLRAVLESYPGEFAAVIMEAIAIAEPSPGFLEGVRDLAHEHGAVLIFDEIVNGFRLAVGGAQEYFGVVPDLATFGKGMANGMPMAALVGRDEYMRELDEVFFSFTFGGEALSLAASQAALAIYAERDVIGHMARLGRLLLDGYNELATRHGVDGHTRCIGLPAHSAIQFDAVGDWDTLTVKSLWQQEVLKRGILSIGVHNLSLAHTEADIERTLAAYDAALAVLAEAVAAGDLPDRLDGEPIRPVFKRW